MKCNGCIYAGREFGHLKNYNGIEIWIECSYPVPYWVMDKAIPKDAEHNCTVKKEGKG